MPYLKEWQTENLSTLKELVLTASDGTLDQLSQNSEQVSNQIDQWFNAERERLIEAQKKRMNTVPGRRFPGT